VSEEETGSVKRWRIRPSDKCRNGSGCTERGQKGEKWSSFWLFGRRGHEYKTCEIDSEHQKSLCRNSSGQRI